VQIVDLATIESALSWGDGQQEIRPNSGAELHVKGA
jgi:hypothetical protein